MQAQRSPMTGEGYPELCTTTWEARMDARTTIQQIGRVTLGSVGARRFKQDGDSLIFTISRGHRYVRITLDPSDTYSVRTYMVRSGRLAFEQTDVYCDQLAQVIWDAHLERSLNAHLASDPRYMATA